MNTRSHEILVPQAGQILEGETSAFRIHEVIKDPRVSNPDALRLNAPYVAIAHDLENDNNRVVIKSEYDQDAGGYSKNGVERERAVYQLLGRYGLPGIVDVHKDSLLIDGAGNNYHSIITDFASQGSLDGLSISNPIAAREYARKMADPLRISDALNNEGLINGDVKNQNFVLSKSGIIKTIDLEFVQPYTQNAVQLPGELNPTQIHGSYKYICPERYILDMGLDPRDDVFSVAVSMAEVLGGRDMVSVENIEYDSLASGPLEDPDEMIARKAAEALADTVPNQSAVQTNRYEYITRGIKLSNGSEHVVLLAEDFRQRISHAPQNVQEFILSALDNRVNRPTVKESIAILSNQ